VPTAAARGARAAMTAPPSRRVALGIVAAVVAIVGLAPFAGPLVALPSNAAGMAARSVCSGAFVAGRPWRDVLAQDVLPASAVLRWVDVEVDEPGRTVRARFPGGEARVARRLPGRGCVLEGPGDAARPRATGPGSPAGIAATRAATPGRPDAERRSADGGPAASAAPGAGEASSAVPSVVPPAGQPGNPPGTPPATASTVPSADPSAPASTVPSATPSAGSSAGSSAGPSAPPPATSSTGPAVPADRGRPWPQGDAAVPPQAWGEAVDRAALERVLEAAFEGAGDPAGANARGVAIVHRGRLLADRGAPGFPPGTPLHGWSMSKTVLGLIAHDLAARGALDLDARLVDAFPARGAPAWVERWRADARADVRVADLLHMRDGLAQREEYGALGSVPRMLWGGADVAAAAADAAPEAPAGTRWRYLSASSNLLARAIRARFPDDDGHLAAAHALFDAIGARTAVVETDADGTWIGSSYLWASAADWARLGWLALSDGRWGDARPIAPGWLARASRPALDDGEGRGYGAHVWRIGDPRAGACRDRGLPEDALAMRGHWGQVVAIVPSREAVVVRLGWTFDRARFDACAFVAQVLATLR